MNVTIRYPDIFGLGPQVERLDAIEACSHPG